MRPFTRLSRRPLVVAAAILSGWIPATAVVVAQTTEIQRSAESEGSPPAPAEPGIRQAPSTNATGDSRGPQDGQPTPDTRRQRYDPARIPFVSGPPPQDLVDLASKPPPWAVAFTPDGQYFYRWGTQGADPSREALEACEFVHQQACIPYAASGWVTAQPDGAAWTTAPQDTLRQAGQRLDADRIPFVGDADRGRIRSLIGGLRSGQHHVLTLSAAGAWWFVSGDRADGQQRNALAQCNQARTNKSFPCFVFQVDGTVVMQPGGIDAQTR